MTIHFAPLQGFTDYVYRTAHHDVCGGVDYYYTPFLRWEKEGVRNKDLRDIAQENNGLTPTIPQIICDGKDEMERLVEVVTSEGYRKVDINMGCPFPMQTRRGRGAGLLPHPEVVKELGEIVEKRTDLAFSVKMRLGLERSDEWQEILPILNDLPLTHITVHPRVGKQMYKGAIQMEAFEEFLDKCKHAVVYNGDLTDMQQISALEQRFPQLDGIMIGRSLLATPTLAYELQHPEIEMDDEERRNKFWQLHDRVYRHATTHLQGESQILARLHSLWEYPSPLIDKKWVKKMSKSGNLRSYNEAVAMAKRQNQQMPYR